MLVQGHTETDSCPSFPPTHTGAEGHNHVKPCGTSAISFLLSFANPFPPTSPPSACVYLRLARIPELPCDLLCLRLSETRATRVNESHIPTPADSQSRRVRGRPLPPIAGCGPGGAAHVGLYGFGRRRWCARGGLFQSRHQSREPPGTRGGGAEVGRQGLNVMGRRA